MSLPPITEPPLGNTNRPPIVITDIDRCRIIDKKELRKFVPYTPHHIARLEAAGKFPRRLRFGSRVGWVLGEVLDWIEDRKRERDARARSDEDGCHDF